MRAAVFAGRLQGRHQLRSLLPAPSAHDAHPHRTAVLQGARRGVRPPGDARFRPRRRMRRHHSEHHGARRRSQAERLVAWPEKPAGVTFTGETLRDRFEVRDDGLYLVGGTLVIVR